MVWNEKKHKIMVVVFATLLIVIDAIAIVRPKNKDINEEKYRTEITKNYKDVSNKAIEFLKVYNTMYTVDNYEKDLKIVKEMCEENFYKDMFINNENRPGLSDNMDGYNMNIMDYTTGPSESNNTKTIIYEIETYGETEYPTICIIEMNSDKKVISVEKILPTVS